MRILFITTEWPTDENQSDAPFLVQYADALRETGIRIDVFHFRGNSNPLSYIKAWFTVRKTRAWKEADLLHAHWGQSGFVGLCSSKPMVITYHGSDLLGIPSKKGKNTIKGKLLVAFSRWISWRADKCITVSNQLGNKLPKGVPFEVIPMGIDLELFQPMDQKLCRKELGINLEKTVILFVSNPARIEKRFELASQSVNLLKVMNPELDIELIPVFNQPIHNIPIYLNASDALLLTSFHEGSPVVIKEALACNVPIVAKNVGDVSERIGQIEGCYVSDDDSAEAFARKLSLSLTNFQRIDGRESILHLSWKTIAEKTKALYFEVMTEAGNE